MHAFMLACLRLDRWFVGSSLQALDPWIASALDAERMEADLR